ncbi:MAG TPA: dihydroneopterin aldolase [Ferruginibacter sp.]|nr:dihydroneopterin aldolase [Ferruginibacter sp.]
MFTITLSSLQFHSFHGVYEEERLLGNQYEVDVELEIEGNEKVSDLDQTFNYETAYSVITKRMSIPTPLLETVAEEMVQSLADADKRIRSVRVKIQKKFPPFASIQGAVGVSYKKEY